MGQLQPAPGAQAALQCSQFASLSVAELEACCAERGLVTPCNLSHRALLTSLLMGYDKGLADSARLVSSKIQAPARSSEIEEAPGQGNCPSVLATLQRIRDAPGHMGCDIGGTLCKMALALPKGVAADYHFPVNFGETGQFYDHLDLCLALVNGEEFIVRFVTGMTWQMEEFAQHLGLQRRFSQAKLAPLDPACDFVPPEPSAGEVETESEANRNSLSSRSSSPQPASAASPSTSPLVPLESVDLQRSYSDWTDEIFSTYRRPIRRMATAGGGACKFAPLFRDALRVEVEPVRELSAVVGGFMLLAPSEFQCGCPDISTVAGCDHRLFTVDDRGTEVPLPWPKPLFPLIMANMGSGVSILLVKSADPADFVRVGGTACGGSTFLGLARELTSAKTFEDALRLAEGGDRTNVDKSVGDIYGEEGCQALGLGPNLTAANFGKLAEGLVKCSQPDIALSLLNMVTQQSVLLTQAFAKQYGCMDRVFFVGGFVVEANFFARQTIANNLRSFGGCAYFLRHCDFLGALGSLRCAFRVLQQSTGQTVAE